MPTQLNYSFRTQPNAGYLIASQTAELEFTVSNPGDPVSLNSLAFTFPYGSAGSDLCASVSDVSATTLPGPGWTAGTDRSGNFVLTPPGGSLSVDSNGLAFTLSIEVNAQVGVVNLNNDPKQPVQSFIIIETTDAGKAYWSPADSLSKFPSEFVFSDLMAIPPIAQQGAPIELSWTGTPGSSYTIDWPDDEAIIYSGGPAPITQGDTSFPPEDSGQTLTVGATESAVFFVTAEYTSGGQTLRAGPLPVPVPVNLAPPTITSFTATWRGPVLELNWTTENARSVEIPSITTEPQIPNPEIPFLFTPSITQPLPLSITLIALNQGPQTASRTLQESYQQVAGSPVSVGGGPFSVTVSPDSARVFVANEGDNTLTVLDAQTLQPIAESPVPAGEAPMTVAVSPDSTRVFVTNLLTETSDGALTVLDARTLQPIAGSPVPVGDYPTSLAVSPDGKRVYVANLFESTLTVLDAQTLQPITGSPGGGPNQASVAVSPDSTRVYVANVMDGTLTVLDAGTLQPISGSPFSAGDYPQSLAVSPDGTRVYVVNGNGLTVLNAGTLEPITGFPFSVGDNPQSVAVSPDGTRVFLVNNNDPVNGTLMVLDAGTLQPVAGSPVSVGNTPTSVAVSPDGTRVFVVNSGDNTLTVLTGEGPDFYGPNPAM